MSVRWIGLWRNGIYNWDCCGISNVLKSSQLSGDALHDLQPGIQINDLLFLVVSPVNSHHVSGDVMNRTASV